MEKLNLDIKALPDQLNEESWPSMKIKFQEIFLERTQQEWTSLFYGVDACVTPVLSFTHPIPNSTPTDNQELWPRIAAMPQPAPYLSRTPAKKAEVLQVPFMEAGKHSIEILSEFGLDSTEIQTLLASGAIADSSIFPKL